ncbi:MAG: hypothetical protein Q6M04_04375 [Thermostichus sp. BF3_bins_97]
MLRPSFLFSGSALLGLMSLLILGGECGLLARRQRSIPQVPLHTLEQSLAPSQMTFVVFEDEPDPAPLLAHQAQLQERVQELERRSQAHQQQAHQWLSHRVDRRGIPQRTPTLAPAARPRRQDPTLSQAAAQPVAPNYLARLSQQMDREPGNAQLYLQRAQYFWHQSQEDPFAPPQPEHASAIAHLMRSALRDLNIAIALDPYLSEAYLLKARIQYERLREPDQALATLSPLDRFAYRNPQLHLLRSRIWAEQGHLESAFDVSHLAIELAQQNQTKADLFDAYVHRGLLWGSICDLSLAIQDFSRAIDLLPHRGDPYYYRGIAGAYSGSDLRRAAADLGSALMLWRASGTGSPARLEHAELMRRELFEQLRQ